MKYIGLIPARYKSTRYLGKPLCNILDKPMIYHVYMRAKKWEKWYKLYVATDDERIAKCCENYNINYIMTYKEHMDGIDRCTEACEILEKQNIIGDRYIIIQGDEPLFDIKIFKDVDMQYDNINFYSKIDDINDVNDINIVKTVISKNNKAIYFSRYPIPYHDNKTKKFDKNTEPIFYKQLGIYIMSKDVLYKYNELEMTKLEGFEGVGLNRFIENDINIYMYLTDYNAISVDTPEDRERVEKIMLLGEH